MSKNALLIIILFLLVFIIGIANMDLKNEGIKTIIEVVSTIGSAVIGGYIAFYAAYIQIRSNKKMDSHKENKKERNICILVKNDLKDIENRINAIISEKSHYHPSEFNNYIYTSSLEKFKTDYIHILDNDKHVLIFSSVLNRLILLMNSPVEQEIKLESLIKLVEDIKVVRTFISEYLSNADREIQSYLDEEL